LICSLTSLATSIPHAVADVTEECSGGGTITISGNAVVGSSSCVGTVAVPAGVTEIGSYAFQNASDITSIRLPNSLVTIGAGSFADMAKLQTIIIQQEGSLLRDIGERAFQGTPLLTSIFIPENVQSIASNAFSDAGGLTSINVDGRNTYFKSLDGVLFSYSMETLFAFPAAKRGTPYRIPEDVEFIGENAFGSTQEGILRPLSDR
jgi:hypothetical protein